NSFTMSHCLLRVPTFGIALSTAASCTAYLRSHRDSIGSAARALTQPAIGEQIHHEMRARDLRRVPREVTGRASRHGIGAQDSLSGASVLLASVRAEVERVTFGAAHDCLK